VRAFFHPKQKLHYPQSYYSRGAMRKPQEVPERAERLVAAAAALGMTVQEPADFGMEPLKAVHDEAYLAFLREAYNEWRAVPEDWGNEVMSNIFVREPNALRGILAKAGRYLADGSCPIGPQTWTASYWSAQSAIAAARTIISGEDSAYAICRPPGHHARKQAAGGFCYLNNAAIAGQELRKKYGRVAILDPDMHHGQGIQEIFYDRDDVMYVSIHGDPTNFYPAVAGFEDERGAGEGEGFNINLPMAHGAPESSFFEKLTVATEAIARFDAEVLVLAIGFDIYELDPQSKVAVTRQGFEEFGKIIRQMKLPTLIVQEGGYHLESLESNASAFFGRLDDWNAA
jgi:acetoin utilization deacetylase AcuC-like enzyme